VRTREMAKRSTCARAMKAAHSGLRRRRSGQPAGACQMAMCGLAASVRAAGIRKSLRAAGWAGSRRVTARTSPVAHSRPRARRRDGRRGRQACRENHLSAVNQGGHGGEEQQGRAETEPGRPGQCGGCVHEMSAVAEV
jgi:hypothetical protein